MVGTVKLQNIVLQEDKYKVVPHWLTWGRVGVRSPHVFSGLVDARVVPKAVVSREWQRIEWKLRAWCKVDERSRRG
jgi:hypothetical protein